MHKLASPPRQVLGTILYIVLVVLCLHLSTSSIEAATGINKQINFQGKVVNTNGTNVSNGSYDFVFKIYTVSSGGAAVWTETWNSGTSQVTVTDGVFRVALGTHTSLPGSIDFNTDNIYLGVEFNGDGEMTPRVRFTAVPYAFNALKVAGLTVTDTTGTFTLANSKTLTVNNTLTFSGTDSTAFTLPGSSDTLAGVDAAQTLTNKTLTAPKFADGGFLADASGNELLVLDSNASAVNEITLANAATGNGVSLAATGGDTNVAFSITSKATGALTLDSGTTGTVNLGTGNNAKTLNLGTGNAGNTINIGTNNTVSDTISIGSALDNVAITGDDWSITSGGVLTVASCTGCGGGGGANTALSNLASVAINTSLVSDADVTDDLGTSANNWKKLYIGGNQTTNTYGIQFGPDGSNPANLYRSAADTLKTDDAFNVGGNFNVTAAGVISGVTGYTQGSGTMSVTTNATTGTGSSSGIYLNADSVTSGNGLYINAASLIANGSAQYINASSAVTSGTTIGSTNVLSVTNGSSSSGSFLGLRGQSYVNNSAALTGVAAGLEGVAQNANTQTVSHARGVQGFVNQSNASGTISNGRAFFGQIQNTAGTITTGSGLYIADASSNGTLGTQYGVYIDALTKGSTDIGIYVADADTYSLQLASVDGDVASGITFGTDTNLYRSGADTLSLGAGDSLILPSGAGYISQTYTGTSTDAINITAASLTSASALEITGSTTTSPTDHFVKIASDITNVSLMSLAADFSGSGTSFGIYANHTDSTSNTNTDYASFTTLALTGNAAKTGYGSYTSVSTNSTAADTLYGHHTLLTVAGAMASGTTRDVKAYSASITSNQNHTTGTANLYGGYFDISGLFNSTGNTQNVYGQYVKVSNSAINSGITNGYGLYVDNGTSNTNGTSKKYGIYIAPQTSADENYGLCFDCDGTWSSSTVAAGIQFGTDANAVTLYRSGSDVLQTGDSLTVDLDMTVSGGDITGANSAAIDLGEATSGSITLSGPATGTSAGFVRVPVKTDAGDPTTTQTNGAIYYNSNSNKFRCYEASAWANCIGSGGTPTWNGITDPTGTQTLAFGDAELNAWTISSDTETFWTMTADSLTTGKLYDISLDGLTTGVGINMQSTSTALTTGNLMNLEWAPAGSITSTSDLFVMNIGSGDLANSYINLKDNGSSVLSVSQTQFTTSLPTNFTASGDVSIAYDIAFTNPTASYITSLAPITIRSGESFNSSDLTLQTYNYGNIIFATSDNGIMRIPVKSTTGDPTNNAEGNMYYNDFDNKFRCYQGSAWTDCIGSGGSTTLQQAYDAGTPTILTDASGDIIFQVIGGATDTQFKVSAASAPEVDMTSITNAGFGTSTDGVDGLSINFVQADDAAGTDTNAGLNVGIKAASDDAGDILSAISISVTSPTANNRERGISIGSGFDEDIYFASASAQVRMQDGGEIEFTDGSMGGAANNDLPLARLKEYFAGANYGTFEAQGFINIDGSFFMENFVSNRVVQTADQTNQTGRFGDNSMWSLDELGTGGTASNATMGCSVVQNNVATQSTYNVNGVLEISYETASNTNGTNLTGPACQVYLGASTLTGTNLPANAFLQAANKFVVYYKFRPGAQYTNTATNKYMWFGVNNHTAPWQGMPTVTHTNKGGMWISNVTSTGSNAAADTVWSGVVQYGTNRTTVGCTSPNITTNAYALARIEARATNDVHFFLDSDVSNGVALSECGAGVTSNIPTVQMRPAINAGNFTSFTSTAALWTVYVDLFAYVQDDPRDLGAPAAGMTQENEAQTPPVFNPINGADLAEHYIFSTEDQVEAGDVVSLGETAGEGDKVSRPYDRKLLGVIAESPGLVLGESAPDSLPVAISGRVPVKVTAKNGAIKVGDPITSSDIPGVAMRATAAGKILGTAMESFDGSSCSSEGTDSGQARMTGTQCVGKILVSINPGYYINDGQDLAIIENQPEMSLGATGSGTLEPSQGVAVQAEAQDGGFVSDPSVAQQIVSNLVIFNNGLRVDKVFESLGDAVFYGKTRFEGAVEYVASVVFKSDVEFEKEVVFNSDTAGYAVIKKGQRFVDVGFEQEYKNQPVIQVSPSIFKLTETTFKDMIAQDFCTELEGIEVCQDKLVSTILDSDLNYAVQNQTTQGFLIVLDREAPVDMTFSWQAAAIKNVKTAVNNGPAGLIRPFTGDYEVSNKFGEHSLNPAIQEKDAKVGLLGHDGFDIAVPMKTPILAVDDGVVESRNSDYGLTLVLKHEWGETLYGHLSETTVEVGQKVSKGQEIALSGNSGLTTGPHLHFGMKLNDSKNDNGYRGFVNPNLYIAFEKHRAAGAVAGVSTSLETQISASSSSILHTEEERVVSSSSASVRAEGNTTKILEKGGKEL